MPEETPEDQDRSENPPTEQHRIDSSVPTDNFRALTHLVVGGVEIGIDELLLRLSEWEKKANKTLENTSVESDTSPSLPGPNPLKPTPPIRETDADLMRYALIGLLFETQEVLQKTTSTLGKLERMVTNYTDPFVRPIVSSRFFAPFRRRYEKLVERGQEEVDRWISVGREEEIRSRILAQDAITGTVDGTIEYLADNQEIQDLIQTQTTSLAGELVEEIRERSVNMDILLEGLIRSLFRRQPRAKLPKPPLEVRRQGPSLRPDKQLRKTRVKIKQL
jgi:hypothetical protein